MNKDLDVVKNATEFNRKIHSFAYLGNKDISHKSGSDGFYQAVSGHYERISEEAKELFEAIGERDNKEILDAAVDLQYVITGLLIELENAGYKVAEACDRVALNNLSKVGLTFEEAVFSAEQLTKDSGIDHIAEHHKESDTYCIKRVFDNKICKPVKGYVEVDIEDCLPEGVE